jgi:hypothetical protein
MTRNLFQDKITKLIIFRYLPWIESLVVGHATR